MVKYIINNLSVRRKGNGYEHKTVEIESYFSRKTRILSSEYDLPPLVSDVLVGRGLDTPQAVEDFFSADSDFFDPFSILDMDRAAERILQALERDEKIAVYGDYDCDGVTATAILYQYFVSIGANAVYYIPERDGEGYGLNAAAVQSLSEQGVGLIVTVDNGISAVAEVNLVKRLGMDIVITDHHQPGDTLPDAAAVVDPHRKDCGSPYPLSLRRRRGVKAGCGFRRRKHGQCRRIFWRSCGNRHNRRCGAALPVKTASW